MKWSQSISASLARSLNDLQLSSQKVRTSCPALAAACWIFIPCSSVPVHSMDFFPNRACHRLRTSVKIEVYRCPTCGSGMMLAIHLLHMVIETIFTSINVVNGSCNIVGLFCTRSRMLPPYPSASAAVATDPVTIQSYRPGCKSISKPRSHCLLLCRYRNDLPSLGSRLSR